MDTSWLSAGGVDRRRSRCIGSSLQTTQWIAAGESAHISQTIYYSALGDPTYPECGDRPAWAELPCESQPAAQPGTAGLPELPVVTDTYNMWDEPETVTEAFGSTLRTKKMTYDNAGRLLTNQETSTIDTSVPKVTNEYNSETGALTKQSITSGETSTGEKSESNRKRLQHPRAAGRIQGRRRQQIDLHLRNRRASRKNDRREGRTDLHL